MRILDLQRRLREVGRIRIGEQVPTGNGKTRPAKLDNFRLTSSDHAVIAAAAARFGGEPAKWDTDDGVQWEVKTTSAEIPVIVPPGDMSFSQSYEVWSAGGCKVRCDGRWDFQGDQACHCDPTNRVCAIHTRLSVIIPELPGLGLWRLETHGYYAAVELGGVVDLAADSAERGVMLPARLRIEHRSVKRFKPDGKPETRRFIVPVLDLDVHPMSLTAGGNVRALEGAPAALPAGRSFIPVPSQLSEGGASVAEQVAQVGITAGPKPRKNAAAPIPATGVKPRTAAEATVPQAGPVCARCGGLLIDCAVGFEGGAKVHKGACPSGGEAPSTTGLDGEPATAEAEQVPAASVPPAPPDVRDLDLHKLCEEVFRSARDAAPRGQKTKVGDRLRHCMVWAISRARTIHLADLTVEERNSLFDELVWLRDGQRQWEITDAGLLLTNGDTEIVVPFAAVEALDLGEGEAGAADTANDGQPDASSPSTPEPFEMTVDDWRAYLTERGVKVTKLLAEAQRLAALDGEDVPASLDDIIGRDALCELLFNYVQDLADKAAGS